MAILFQDRRDAGQQLGERLAALALPAPLVLALPRGGVPVAFEIARRLRAPLGVILVRKLGAPFNPEYAIGAVARIHQAHTVLDPHASRTLHADWLEEQINRQFAEIERRRQRYVIPGGQLAPPLAGRTAIVVDDGIATGYTLRAALTAVAEEKPQRLLFAAPVGSPEVVRTLQGMAEGICLSTPPDFRAVSPYYSDFTQTEDAEVLAVLAQARDLSAAQRKENTMQTISEVMTRDVAVVGPNDTVRKAAQLMSEWDVGALPVCDGRRLLGMITDRDITVRATAQGRGPEEMRVSEVMSEGLSYCFDDQRVGEVLQQMGDEQIRRLPVVDRNMELCGMVSIGDLAVQDDASVDDAMQGISWPAEPTRPSGEDASLR